MFSLSPAKSCDALVHLTCPRTLQAALYTCHIWAMDSVWHCSVALLSLWILWPAMRLEISAWPTLMTREIRKWLEGAEGFLRQAGKGTTWVEAPCFQNIGTVCFLPDHLVYLSHERWPSTATTSPCSSTAPSSLSFHQTTVPEDWLTEVAQF